MGNWIIPEIIALKVLVTAATSAYLIFFFSKNKTDRKENENKNKNPLVSN